MVPDTVYTLNSELFLSPPTSLKPGIDPQVPSTNTYRGHYNDWAVRYDMLQIW